MTLVALALLLLASSGAGLAHPGNRAFLGVGLEEETEYAEGGARITHVVEDSAAARAGLQRGDVIVGIDGRTIRGPVALSREIRSKQPGDPLSIAVVRDGVEQTFDVELGEPPRRMSLGHGDAHVELFECEGDDCDVSAETCEGEDCRHFNLHFRHSQRPMLGVQLVETTDELRHHLGSPDDRGVLISRVLPGSPAEESGIEVGDLLISVAGEPVEDAGDIRGALRGRYGETFDVEVVREHRPLRLTVTLPQPEDEESYGPRSRWEHPAAGDALREAERLSREARRLSREAFRSAMRQAAVEERTAFDEARRAYREAMQLSRKAAREQIRRQRETYREAESI
jgi:predicted metalloprotease with PDZ domain